MFRFQPYNINTQLPQMTFVQTHFNVQVFWKGHKSLKKSPTCFGITNIIDFKKKLEVLIMGKTCLFSCKPNLLHHQSTHKNDKLGMIFFHILLLLPNWVREGPKIFYEHLLKFRYFEKATKIWKNIPLVLTLLSKF